MRRVTPIAPEGTPSGLGVPRGQVLAFSLAFLLTAPGAISRLTGAGLGEVVAPIVFGFAILGSAFLLAWAAEVLQLDVSQGLALTVLALIAVLPEYAVDFTFAYKAGENPDKYAPLALANMTGGNRLLIGVGWSLVVAARGLAHQEHRPQAAATKASSTPTSRSSDRTRSRSRSLPSPRSTR